VKGHLIFALWCWVAASASAAFADAVAGRQAFEKGEYDRAIVEWQSSADRGDAESQFGLGTLYEQGAGDLKQDYKRADYWYRKAAEQGNTEAQYRLGLIWAAGGDDFPSDLIEAYKWAVVAVKSKGVWGSAAATLKEQLNQVLTAREREAGRERAAAWQEARTAKTDEPGRGATAPAAAPASSPAAPVAPPVAAAAPPARVKPANAGCPGWPFPTLPCTEQFPALPGAQPPQTAAAASPLPPSARPKTAAANTPLGELNETLRQIDCAVLQARSVEGSIVISGTVPSADQQEKIIQAVTRRFPDSRPAVDVEIVPPPLCRVLHELEGVRSAGFLADGELTVHLKDGGARLRQGEAIELLVQAPRYPVHLRIDYFSLDGQVLHLAPNPEQATSQLAAKESRVFGRAANGEAWIAGGAPFGTELISVMATPAPLNLEAGRPHAEKALDYLHDLRRALGHAAASTATPNALATLFVHTAGH
jgi:hypothetical protein